MRTSNKDTGKEQSFTKSILRTLLILDQFSSADELGIKDLSSLTKLPPSTVQRIVNTLESKNYLQQNPSTLKYRLGLAFFNISRHYSNSHNWVDSAKIHMERLVGLHQENVNLAILEGYSVKYLTKAESPHILRPNFPIGIPFFPAACTGLGKVLLAFKKEVNAAEALARITNPTDKTILDPVLFEQMLEKVRRDGYALEDEEFQPGLFCIGAPIRDANDRVVAALSTSIPKSRLNITELPTLIQDVLDTAHTISADLKASFKFIDPQ